MIKDIEDNGLKLDDTIGPKLDRIRAVYRGTQDGTKPTPEQVAKLKELGITLEKIDTNQEFIEKMEKLRGIGVDVSKIVPKDTILTLAQKTFVNQDEEELKEKIKEEQ